MTAEATRIQLTQPRVFAVLLLALASLQSWWYAGYGFGGSDEGAILVSASRILRGAVFYQDIDAYPFPGSNYLLALVMGIFGEHLSVARFLAGMVYVGIVVTLYFVALRLLDKQRAALFGIALLGCKMLAWPAYTSYFYWDVSLFAACVAVLLLLACLESTNNNPRGLLVGVGAAIGVAFITKQSIGIYLGGAVTLVLIAHHFVSARDDSVETEASPSLFSPFGPLILGFTLAAGPMILYFAAKGLLPQMIYSGLIRPFTDYADTSGISFSKPLRWWEFGELRGTKLFFYYPVIYWRVMSKELLPGGPEAYAVYWAAGETFIRWIYTSLPLIFGAGTWLALRSRMQLDAPAHRNFAVVLLTGAAITASAFPRADFTHLMGVYPVILLLLFASVGHLLNFKSDSPRTRVLRRVEVAAVLSFGLLLFGFSYAQHNAMTTRIDMPTANLNVLPQDAYYTSVVNWVTDEVPEGAPFFIYGHEAHYYFLTQRFSSWTFSQLYPGQDGGDDGATLTEMLKRDPPKVVIQGFLNFPGLPNLQTYTPILNDYLKANYKTDRRPFERYPPSEGGMPSPYWIQIKRLLTDEEKQEMSDPRS